MKTKMGIVHTVMTHVILGAPDKACKGVGICKVIPFMDLTACPCPKIMASIGLSEHGALRFHFRKSSIPVAGMREYFNTALFEVEAAFIIPDFVAQHLSLGHSVIPAGQYPIRETEQVFLVDFAIVGQIHHWVHKSLSPVFEGKHSVQRTPHY